MPKKEHFILQFILTKKIIYLNNSILNLSFIIIIIYMLLEEIIKMNLSILLNLLILKI